MTGEPLGQESSHDDPSEYVGDVKRLAAMLCEADPNDRAAAEAILEAWAVGRDPDAETPGLDTDQDREDLKFHLQVQIGMAAAKPNARDRAYGAAIAELMLADDPEAIRAAKAAGAQHWTNDN